MIQVSNTNLSEAHAIKKPLNYIYVGPTIVWSNTADFNGFLKYYYGNINRFFKDTSVQTDPNAIEGSFVSPSWKGYIPNINKVTTYGLNKDTTLYDLYHTKFIGAYDTELAVSYIDNSVQTDPNAIEGSFVSPLWKNYVPDTNNVVTYGLNKDTKLTDLYVQHIITGIFDKDLAVSYADNSVQTDPNAIEGSFVSPLWKNYVPDTNKVVTYGINKDTTLYDLYYTKFIGTYDKDLVVSYADNSVQTDPNAIEGSFVSPLWKNYVPNTNKVVTYGTNEPKELYRTNEIFDQKILLNSTNIQQLF